MNRRLFWKSATGLFAAACGGTARTPSRDKVERVYDRMHAALCEGLIVKTDGAVRTLHGCVRCGGDGSRGWWDKDLPVFGCWRSRVVWATVDVSRWPGGRDIGRSLYEFTKTLTDEQLRLYMDCGETLWLATMVEATPCEDLAEDEWVRLMCLFGEAYPSPRPLNTARNNRITMGDESAFAESPWVSRSFTTEERLRLYHTRT